MTRETNIATGTEDELLYRIKELVHRAGIGRVTVQLDKALGRCTEDHHVGPPVRSSASSDRSQVVDP